LAIVVAIALSFEIPTVDFPDGDQLPIELVDFEIMPPARPLDGPTLALALKMHLELTNPNDLQVTANAAHARAWFVPLDGSFDEHRKGAPNAVGRAVNTPLSVSPYGTAIVEVLFDSTWTRQTDMIDTCSPVHRGREGPTPQFCNATTAPTCKNRTAPGARPYHRPCSWDQAAATCNAPLILFLQLFDTVVSTPLLLSAKVTLPTFGFAFELLDC
jgi:hypothetical protein